MNKLFFIYILASKRNGTLYIGVTNNLKRRVYEHKEEIIEGFTKKYNVKKLVYFETHENAISATEREKSLKKMERKMKAKFNRKR